MGKNKKYGEYEYDFSDSRVASLVLKGERC
jgi:hypothetical protein